MIQTLARNWWLLVLCGCFQAIYSLMNFFEPGPGGSFGVRTGFSAMHTVVLSGRVAAAAGICTIAAGLWRSARGKAWALVLNGVALTVLGLTLNGLFGWRIKLLFVALLLFVTAIGMAFLDIKAARTLSRQNYAGDSWILNTAGAASIGFAAAFLALAFQWVKLGPGSHGDLLWFGAYFAFSAACMLWLALRLPRILSFTPGETPA